MAEHTKTPWTYRPCRHDDWGWIRGPVMEGEEIGELVAKAHCWVTEDEKDDHRREKTDPYAANAAFIVKAVNNHEALVTELRRARARIEYLGAACASSKHFEANYSEFLPRIDAVLNAERLAEGDGHWFTCSGCHESEDGYDVGYYPFSKVFGCKLGAGCGECGGLGAIWDSTDYDKLMEEHSSTLPSDHHS